MAFPTMDEITEKFVGQPYDLNSVLEPAEIWAYLDAPPERVRVALNAVIAILNNAGDGTSAADNLAIPATIEGSGTTVRERADWLYAKIVGTVLDQIPDRSLTTIKHALASITPAELSFDPATQIELDAIAGIGNTKTVKQLDDEVAAHKAETVQYQPDKLYLDLRGVRYIG